MAHALAIISADLFEELEKIRQIRNRFAHPSDVLHLGGSEIEPLFLALKRPGTVSKSAAGTFVACAKVIGDHLDAHLALPVEPPE